MLPLLFQIVSSKSTKLLQPLCTFLMGDLAVVRDMESCCKSVRRNKREGGKRCHQMNYLCPSLIFQNLLLQTREECGNEDNKLKKKHGEAFWCLSCHITRWSTHDYSLHCTAFSSQRVAWATLLSKPARNKPVHIFATKEKSISSYVKSSDRKLWGNTCHKINQQSYAYHSFQSRQVTPPARITKYIYNNSIA